MLDFKLKSMILSLSLGLILGSFLAWLMNQAKPSQAKLNLLYFITSSNLNIICRFVSRLSQTWTFYFYCWAELEHSLLDKTWLVYSPICKYTLHKYWSIKLATRKLILLWHYLELKLDYKNLSKKRKKKVDYHNSFYTKRKQLYTSHSSKVSIFYSHHTQAIGVLYLPLADLVPSIDPRSMQPIAQYTTNSTTTSEDWINARTGRSRSYAKSWGKWQQEIRHFITCR